MSKIKRWLYRLMLTFATALFVISSSVTSYAHYGSGVITVDGNSIWMGWTHFESGSQGYASAASDGGHAYGRYQFDIGYDFVDFISLCVERYPEHYEGFKKFISASKITKGRGKSSSTNENQPLLDMRGELSAYWQQCCDTYGEEFYELQDEYMYIHYFLAAKNNLKAQGIDLDRYNDARLNGTVWSIAVRDSAGTGSIKKALISTYYDGIGVDEWLNAIYTAETQKHPSQKTRWDQEQRAACFALTDFGGEGGGSYTTGADSSTKSTGIFSFFEKIFDFWSKFSTSLTNIVKRIFNMPSKSWFDGSNENAKITDTTVSAQTLMEIIDEAADKAYAGQYEKLYQQTQAEGLDYTLTADSFSTKGNSLKDLDYAYIMSVYSLTTNMYETTLEQFKKDMENAMQEMSSYTLETKETKTITKVPFYKYKKVTVDTCKEEDVWREIERERDDAEGNTHTYTVTIKYTMHTCTPKDYYVIEKDQYGNPVVAFWITNENGKVVTDFQPTPVKIGEYHDEETDYGVHCPYYYPTDKVDDFGNYLDVYYEIGSGDGTAKEGQRTDYPIFNDVTYGEAISTSKSSGDLFKAFATIAKQKDPNLKINPDTFKTDKYFQSQFKILKPDEGSDESWYDLTRFEDAEHSETEITNFEMAQFRYKRFSAYYGTAQTTKEKSYKKGLTEQEIRNYLKSLPSDISGNRKQVIKTALSLVNQVPYCNNGESSKPRQTGYDPIWYDYTRCDAMGRPSGLDSSGFVQWAFWTAGFSKNETEVLKHTSSISNKLSELVKREDLLPGDIGLVQLGITDDSNESYNRVGIYLGSGEWIVNSSTDGTVVISSSENFSSIKVFSSRMEDDDLYNDEIIFYGTGGAELGGSLYSICQVIEGECGGSSNNAFAAYAELIKNRALSTEDYNGSTAWDIITKSGDFVTYENGTYEQQTPNSRQLDLAQQVFDAKFAVLNNSHVFYAVPQKEHTANYQKGKNYKFDSYDVFETIDAEVYYVDSKYHMSDAGLIQYNNNSTSTLGSGDAALVGQIPNNGGSMPIVYYQQSGGQPWSDLPFGGGNIASSGCSITSLAMVVSYLKGGANSSLWVSPGDIREMIIQKTGNYNRFYSGDSGQSWDIFPNVASYYGLHCSQISSSSIQQSLQQGHPVIMSCVPGEFTKKGHFIVLTGLTSDGHIVVNDPSHPDKSGKVYTLSFIIGQGKGWWAFS